MNLSHFIAKQLKKPSGFIGTQLIGRLMNIGNHSLHIFMLDLLKIQPKDHVMELGFGGGRLLRMIAKEVKQGLVVGVDFSQDMVQQATKRNQRLIQAGLIVIEHASIESLPFPDNHFDKICTANTLYFWPQPEENIKELQRVLKPGGRLVIGFHTQEQMENMPAPQTKEFTLYKESEVQQLLESTGFTQIQILSQESKWMESFCGIAVK